MRVRLAVVVVAVVGAVVALVGCMGGDCETGIERREVPLEAGVDAAVLGTDACAAICQSLPPDRVVSCHVAETGVSVTCEIAYEQCLE